MTLMNNLNNKPEQITPVVQKVLLFLSILLPAVLAYLLLASRFGFYSDDWYVIYGLTTQGIEKLKDIYIIDRPARAYFIGALYSLFGNTAPLYSYSAFIIRVAGASGFFWIIRMIWPRQRAGAYLVTALFVIYPGFLEQPNAFEFQTHIFSFSLAIFSIAFTIKACQTQSKIGKILLVLTAALSAFAYMSLMEYYIGIEGVRFTLLFYMNRQNEGKAPQKYMSQMLLVIRQGWLSVAAVGSYFFWRLFIFENQRSNTDFGSMLGTIVQSPIYKSLWMMNYLLQNFFNITFFSWSVPVYDLVFTLRLKEFWKAAAVGSIAMIIFFFIIYFCFKDWVRSDEDVHQDNRVWGRDIVLIGFFSVLFTSLPIVFGNRHVVFDSFSRFSLPGSIGGILILSGLIFMLYQNLTKVMIFSLLVGMAVTVHYANSIQFVTNWESMRSFWWQMVWRAPQIQPDTVLYVQYSNAAVVEDYIAWGPANLIYAQGKTLPNTNPLRLSATVLNQNAIQKIRMGGKETRERRGLVTVMNYDNPLVVTMPSQLSCVHTANGQETEYSEFDTERQYLIAPYSRLERIITDTSQAVPPPEIFGDEPPHNWCYYYEKADLARQMNDWQEVKRLEAEAKKRGYYPDDSIEWLPFMEAEAFMGDIETASRYIPLLKVKAYQTENICMTISSMKSSTTQQFPEGFQFLKSSFCE